MADTSLAFDRAGEESADTGLGALRTAFVEDETASSAQRFRALASEYLAFVLRSLRHLGVAEADVEDAAQHVFLVVARKLGRIEIGKERSFLYGTAVRIAMRTRAHARRRAHEQGVPSEGSDADGNADPAPGPDELVSRSQARTLLSSILSAMDDDLRTVFVLFEIEQLPVAEIAAALEIPLGTVKSRLRRAREDFDAKVRRARARLRGGDP